MLVHMLKCKYQNEYKNKVSWRTSIISSLFNLKDAFGGKFGKGSLFKKFYTKNLDLNEIYQSAVKIASNEIGLSKNIFPKTCEWSKSQLVDEEFIDDFIDTYGKGYE